MRWLASFLWVGLLGFGLSQSAAQEPAPEQIIVNYAEIVETTGSQSVSFYVTLLDSNRRSVANPRITDAEIVVNGQAFPATVQVPQSNLNIVLVLDTSGSMLPSADPMRSAAIQAVNSAPAEARFAVIQFNEIVFPLSGFNSDRTSVISSLNSLTNLMFKGGTCLYDAVFDAVGLLNAVDVTTRPAIILFTDGRDELIAGGELDQCSTRADFNRVIEAANVRNVPIYTIGMQGEEPINQQELESMANSTGGLYAFGSSSELTSLFQQIIQAIASQHLVRADVCAPAGTHSITLNITTDSGSLSTSGDIELGSTCIQQAGIVTPISAQLTIDAPRYDPATHQFLFRITTLNASPVAEYQVQISNAETGLLIDGEFGDFTVSPGAAQPIGIPLDNVTAQSLRIKVYAYDSNRVLLGITESDSLLLPVTPVPTAQPSPTPIITVPEITGITHQYLEDDDHEFTLNLRIMNPEQIEGYSLRLEDRQTGQLIYDLTQRSEIPPSVIRLKASETGKEIPPGDYLFTLEVFLKDAQLPIVDQQEIVVPLPEKKPITETISSKVRESFFAAFGLVMIAMMTVMAVLWYFDRLPFRKKQPSEFEWGGTSHNNRVETGKRQNTYVMDFDADHTVHDAGAKLLIMSMGNRTLNQEHDLRQRTRVGRGGNPDYPVDLVVHDPYVSANHFTIQYHNGSYWLQDDGSHQGTLVNGNPAQHGRSYQLNHGDTIQISPGSKFRFMNMRDELVWQAKEKQSASPRRPAHPVRPQPSQRPHAAAARPAAPQANRATPKPQSNREPPVIEEQGEPLNPRVRAVLRVVETQDETLQANQEFTIPNTIFVVGKLAPPKVDMCLRLNYISRRHILLKYVEDAFHISDLESLNGTKLNGEKLVPNKLYRLEPGIDHEITLGLQKEEDKFTFYYTIEPISRPIKDPNTLYDQPIIRPPDNPPTEFIQE